MALLCKDISSCGGTLLFRTFVKSGIVSSKCFKNFMKTKNTVYIGLMNSHRRKKSAGCLGFISSIQPVQQMHSLTGIGDLHFSSGTRPVVTLKYSVRNTPRAKIIALPFIQCLLANDNTKMMSTKSNSDETTDVKSRIVLGQSVKPDITVDVAHKKPDDKQKGAKALWWTKFSFVIFSTWLAGLVGYLIVVWGPPDRDDYGDEIKDEFSDKPKILSSVLRAFKKINIEIEGTKAPCREKLLPEPLEEPYYQPPYTLVIEMTDVLVHPEHSFTNSWRFKKRPGVDYFLQQVGPPLFEIVIYTVEGGQTAWPVLDSLDPNGFIMYRLFRDATRYQKGKHYKDLNCLNRDLSKVIAVDWSADALSLNPDNALIIRRWAGEDHDVQLPQLAAFLRTIATSGVDDVRPVLKYYSKEPDPIEAFTVNQRKLQEEQAMKLAQSMESEKQQRPGGSLVSSWKGGLFSRH